MFISSMSGFIGLTGEKEEIAHSNIKLHKLLCRLQFTLYFFPTCNFNSIEKEVTSPWVVYIVV